MMMLALEKTSACIFCLKLQVLRIIGKHVGTKWDISGDVLEEIMSQWCLSSRISSVLYIRNQPVLLLWDILVLQGWAAIYVHIYVCDIIII